MHHLGIDIGGSSVKTALVGGSGDVRTGRSASYVRPSADRLIEAIRAAIAALRSNMGADGSAELASVRRIGICAPGRLDASGRVIEASINVPSLAGVSPESLVEAALRHRIAHASLWTDAHAGAHDLWATRSVRGRLLAISLGTGVGACVLDDGVRLGVAGASSGHLGQMDVTLDEPGAPIGPDGGAGSLEAYIGLPALIGRYGPDLEGALALLTETEAPVRALARAIRIAHAIYRPDHVVLAGGIGIRLGHLLPVLRSLIGTRLTSLARPGWTLTTGSTEFHGAIGAARLAADRVT